MKIALVSPYDFAHPGGVVHHISCLERQFSQMGHDVKIIAPASKAVHTMGDRFIRIGTPRPVPVSGSIARVTVSIRLESQVKEVFEREKFDICHLHEPLMPTLCTTVLRLKRVPMVGTFHAFGGRAWYTTFSPLVKWYLDRWFSKLDGWITVSRPARDYVNTFFPADYEVIPNGVDIDHFNCDVNPMEKFKDGHFNILYIGRLEKRKGFDYLLKAYTQVKRNFPNCRLIAVGPGVRLRRKYQKRVKSNGLSDVVFTGYATYDELPRYYKTADVVCFPATGRESFGIVLLEAMAVGKPIIASEITGFSNVMTNDHEGIMVPPRDEDKLADAIIRMMTNKELREEMASRGRPTALKYDWNKIALQVLDYYKRTLERTGAKNSVPEVKVPRISQTSGKL
jgi:phosphatidylinositol alpha-mannosyltransferase